MARRTFPVKPSLSRRRVTVSDFPSETPCATLLTALLSVTFRTSFLRVRFLGANLCTTLSTGSPGATLRASFLRVDFPVVTLCALKLVGTLVTMLRVSLPWVALSTAVYVWLARGLESVAWLGRRGSERLYEDCLDGVCRYEAREKSKKAL